MALFDTTTQALSAALGAAGLRQQVLANNLANVDTPDFKRSDVSFDGVLQNALTKAQTAGSDSLDAPAATVQTDSNSQMRADGNNVDVDTEMSDLAQNEVRYNALITMASKQMHMLQYEISSGQSGG